MIDKLKEPFPTSQVKWRVGRSGKGGKGVWIKCLAYIDSRAVMDRLDSVVGAKNWQRKHEIASNGTILCSIGVRVGEEWVWKTDGAGDTNYEPEKGGLSDAFKRAAVSWGIGRYLYNLEEEFAEVSKDKKKGWKYHKEGKETVYWKPPELPDWAIPDNEKVAREIRNIYQQNQSLGSEIKGFLKNENVSKLEELPLEKIKELKLKLEGK